MNLFLIEILVVLSLFVAKGAFAMSEMAVVSSRKSRLKQMASDGHAGAAAALRLEEAPNRFCPRCRSVVVREGGQSFPIQNVTDRAVCGLGG